MGLVIIIIVLFLQYEVRYHMQYYRGTAIITDSTNGIRVLNVLNAGTQTDQ